MNCTIKERRGVTSAYGSLIEIVVHRPGSEIDAVDDPNHELWTDWMDPRLARLQHDNLTNTFRRLGVTVRYIQHPRRDKPNLLFCHDLFGMLPRGAILGRPALRVRQGEETMMKRTLDQLAVPSVGSLPQDVSFEGADLLVVDSRLAIVAESQRTSAGAVQWLSMELRRQGIHRVLPVKLPRNALHLDMTIAILGPSLAVVNAAAAPAVMGPALEDLGFRVLELPEQEAKSKMSANIVPIAPHVALIPAEAPRSRQLLTSAGVQCIEANVSELMKGGGSIHCMTGILSRN